MAKTELPTCLHCGTKGVPKRGRDIYPDRPDLRSKSFYACPTCPDVFIGCHRTGRPMGPIMANKPTRQARAKAHVSFDKLWHTGVIDNRRAAYEKLAEFLGVGMDEAHIGHLDEDTALSVAKWADGYIKSAR